MLHEILLSLSGHPSPLLNAELSSSSVISPSERQLLASAAHLSDLHAKLIKHAARITASHPSTVCRAIATAIQSVHLAALRRTVLDVEAAILRDDPALVGAYNIVPLTAVMGAFQPWLRRLEWLWEVVQFIEARDDSGGRGRGRLCWGARAIDRLRAELQSGYRDVEETARTLVAAAETAWLRQVSAWIFYGRLPTAAGGEDFFIRSRGGGGGADGEEEYTIMAGLLPEFVTPATATSMLFIGQSLNQIRGRSSPLSAGGVGGGGFNNTAAKLQAIANLPSPLNSASFTGTIRDIRQSLSQDVLEQILPLSEVLSTMQLLREFFLLGRGEFAMALTQEADERIRSRWRRAGHLAHEKQSGAQGVTIKSGEVSAVLARAWAAMSSYELQASSRGDNGDGEGEDDGDELLDRARDLLRLQLLKAKPDIPAHTRPLLSDAAAALLAESPFSTLLFSVPVTLAIRLPPAVDMVISPPDMQLYCCINAYLLSLRRAHIRLTDLWKLTSLRRHYPGPRGATGYARELRERWSARALVLRSTWTTASAAIFFLGETEAYFQTEVVAGLWRGFQAWLKGGGGEDEAKHDGTLRPNVEPSTDKMDISNSDDEHDQRGDEPAAAASRPTTSSSSAAPARANRHDQQTLSTGHTLYLDTLVHRLLLTQEVYTRPLYALLVHIDHLVAHVHRLHAIFTAIDLETDAGVVDAFANLEVEEAQVLRQLRAVERSVRAGIDEVVGVLETLSMDEEFLQTWEGGGDRVGSTGRRGVYEEEDDGAGIGRAYRPARVGGLNRLLMQLNFGS